MYSRAPLRQRSWLRISYGWPSAFVAFGFSFASVDEHEALRIEIELPVAPALALPQDIWAPPLVHVPDIDCVVTLARSRALSFFTSDPVPGEETMHGADTHRHTALGQSRLNLDQGDIPLLGEQAP